MKARNIDRRYKRGVTLIEVMIALVIISISLASMAVTMGGMLDNATALRERTYASWIAQNKIVEMRIENVLPETGTSSGDIEYAGSDWEWRTEVSKTAVENLFRVDVRISRPGSDDPIRSVTGFLGEPIVPGQSNQVWMRLSSGADSGNRGTTE
jgi:general secretion pathway protein I